MPTASSRQRPPSRQGPAALAARALPWLVWAAVAGTVAWGLWIQQELPRRAFGTYVGAPWPPFFVYWSPAWAPWTPLALAGCLAAALGAPALCGPRIRPGAFLALSYGLALGLRVLLAWATYGQRGWDRPFDTDPAAQNEYLPVIPSHLHIPVGDYLDRFAELAPTLTLHASAHPPGFPVLLDLLGLSTPGAVAWFTILGGALTAPLTYALGRSLLDEPRARVAALLFCFSTSGLIYGATSADALFATAGTAAAVLLLAGGRVGRWLGPTALFGASLLSFALLAVGAWAVLVTALRRGVRAALRLAGLCALALVTGYAALWALFGFDPIGTLAAADSVYRLGIYRVRPYSFWVLGSPVAFIVALGLPLAWLAVRALAVRDAAALGLGFVVATAAVLGFSKAETERIWLFMVPLACVAAASVLPARRLRVVLALLAAQALAVEVLFYTIW